ncbi:MAG: dynamin family protein, partial [Planctomycetota bacterium]|nr:dynamin family protein [Planctomycetota bacterium]
DVDAEQFRSLVGRGADEAGAQPIEEGRLQVPSASWLGASTELIDTPGLSAAADLGEETTLAFLPEADAIVFLTRADHLLGESEMRFLAERMVPQDRARVFVVINMADLVKEERDRADLRARAESALAELVPEGRLCFVSAADGLDAVLDGDDAAFASSGVQGLRAEIERFLREERGPAEAARNARLVDTIRSELITRLRARLAIHEMDDERRALRVEQLEQLLAVLPEDETALLSECGGAFQRLETALGNQVVDPAVRRMEARLRELEDGGRASKDAVGGVLREVGPAAMSEMQGALRDGIPRVRDALGEHLRALLQRTAEGLEVDDLTLAMPQPDFEPMADAYEIEAHAVPAEDDETSREPNVESDALAGTIVASIVALVATGPLAFPLMLTAGVTAALANRKATRAGLWDQAAERIFRPKIPVAQMARDLRKVLGAAMDHVLGAAGRTTRAQLRGIVRSRRDELQDRLAVARSESSEDGLAEVERLKSALEELEPRGLPGPSA